MNYLVRWIVVSLILGLLIGRVMVYFRAHQPSRSQDRSGAFRLLATPFGPRNIVTDIMQGIIIGSMLAFVTLQIIAYAYVTKVNGWTTMFGCGEPGNGVLLRAACASEFPGPINVPQEAMYWTTKTDSAGRKLSGLNAYIIRFPAGQLPPNHAFWSLTMANARNRFVGNPIHRYSVSDRSGLIPNADSSVEIYIQNGAPAGHESNWLPAPKGNFILWLRVYLPGATILDGKYKAPPIVEAR